MLFNELKNKAADLPMSPGVYLMRDASGDVIYIGKAKKLKNRVSQYFVDTVSHTPKTKLMVSKIFDFEIIVAASEFEALVLECSLIKKYLPKYNILLKDDKGYPYLRLNIKDLYPQITMVNRIADDGALYFGPFGSRSITQDLMESIRVILKLPNCNKSFPRDVGKDRVCLHYHMNQCEGWCQKDKNIQEYHKRIEQAKQLLSGNFKQLTLEIKQQMTDAAEALNFELAASLRDRLKAMEALGKKQLVTAGSVADTDVIGFYQNDNRSCFAVLHFHNGNLIDKDYEILSVIEDISTSFSSLLSQYYLNRGCAPKYVLLPFAMEDYDLVEEMLEKKFNRKTKVLVPQRGDKVRLVEMANANAKEEVERITTKEERTKSALHLLGSMLNIPAPKRMEAYDISNISGTDTVASMIVYVDGKPKKGEYKRFIINDLPSQDDYASMRQVLTRRFTHYLKEDNGFDQKPDLLLIDGGIAHAQVALQVLTELKLSIPLFGMVKDDRHRTRALVTANGEEIAIDSQQAVFSLIGNIQEETHRFAITFHRKIRSKRLRYSELDTITGIGEKRKQDLLKAFKSIAAIKEASIEELQRILPSDAANSVYKHFHERGEV